MYELRLVVSDNSHSVIGKDDTLVQAIARLKVWSGNAHWEVVIIDHNTVRFVWTDSYDIVWIPKGE